MEAKCKQLNSQVEGKGIDCTITVIELTYRAYKAICAKLKQLTKLAKLFRRNHDIRQLFLCY